MACRLGFLCWPMADRFYVVAVRIEDEGPKVGRMVLGAKPGTTVVAPARRNGRLVKSLHPRTVIGDEGHVDGVARLALEDPEVRLARAPESCGSVAGLHDQLVAERGEGLLVEALAPLEVRHWDPHVIQHPSPPTASRTEPTPIGSSIPVASTSATSNFREPCMRSSRMPLHGRAGEVSAGASRVEVRWSTVAQIPQLSVASTV